MGIKAVMGRAARVAAMGLWLACSAAGAQEAAPMDQEGAAKVAARAIDAAAALADMLDVSKSDLGPSPTMAAALEHAHEVAPKPLEGMGAWFAAAEGAVRAPVSEPLLCRALMDQCAAKAKGEPNLCGCKPDGAGAFVFALRINAIEDRAVEGE